MRMSKQGETMVRVRHAIAGTDSARFALEPCLECSFLTLLLNLHRRRIFGSSSKQERINIRIACQALEPCLHLLLIVFA